MKLSTLAVQIQAYQDYTKLSQVQFCQRLGISTKTLRNLYAGKSLSPISKNTFEAALKKKTISPDDPIPLNPQQLRRQEFKALELLPSIRDEQEVLTNLVKRYLVRTTSWKRANPRKGATDTIEILAEKFLAAQATTQSTIPYQRQCLVIGMIQGMMLKEGIMSAVECMEDHNTLYYVP